MPTADLHAEPYRDHKRFAWLLSLFIPTTVLIGPALMLNSGQPWMLWIPVVFFYSIVPLLDRILGEDKSNPPESAVPALDADLYYRWITYLLAPCCGALSFSVPGLWHALICLCTPWLRWSSSADRSGGFALT